MKQLQLNEQVNN